MGEVCTEKRDQIRSNKFFVFYIRNIKNSNSVLMIREEVAIMKIFMVFTKNISRFSIEMANFMAIVKEKLSIFDRFKFIPHGIA